MNHTTLPRVIVTLAACVALAGCDSKPAPPAKPSTPQASTTSAPTPAPAPQVDPSVKFTADVVSVMGLSFPVPEGWTSSPPANPMRLAEMHAPDDCSVVFSSAGGSVEGNITRWAGQVQAASGAPESPAPTVTTIAGLRVTTAEFVGSYAGMGETAPRPNWMLRGAIVETPGGLLFIKMTGPADPMRAGGPAFTAMLASMKNG